jgi:hypothetical protein
MTIGSGISGGISAVDTAHTTGVTVDLPSGLSSGDFMVLFVFKDFDTASTFDSISGWTRITALNTIGTSGRNRQSATWYRVYDGTEGSTITSTGTGTDAHENSAVIIGWPDSDGFDVTPTTAHKNAQDNSFTPTCEPITTVTDGAMVATFSGMTFAAMDPWVAPTGYTMVDGEVTPTQGKLGVAEKVRATAGLETPGDWNNTNGDSRDESVVITVAIKPSAGGGGTFKPYWALNRSSIINSGIS